MNYSCRISLLWFWNAKLIYFQTNSKKIENTILKVKIWTSLNSTILKILRALLLLIELLEIVMQHCSICFKKNWVIQFDFFAQSKFVPLDESHGDLSFFFLVIHNCDMFAIIKQHFIFGNLPALIMIIILKYYSQCL